MRTIEKIVQSPTAPLRQDVIWIDTSDPSSPVVKIYVNGEWKPASDEASEIEILQNEIDIIKERILSLEKPLIFEAVDELELCFITTDNQHNRNIEYSTDLINWVKTASQSMHTSIQPFIRLVPGEKVYIRGHNSSYAKNEASFCFFAANGKKIKIGGNLSGLVMNQENSLSAHPFIKIFNGLNLIIDKSFDITIYNTTSRELYSRLFSDSKLQDASNIVIDNFTVDRAERSCSYMFYGCNELVIPPTIINTICTKECFRGMFQYCNNLKIAPALPATTLASYCYDGMFSDCRSLTEAPELPATILSEYCYNGMFMNCSSLVTAPALPAANLMRGCYLNMFHSCKALTESPILVANDCTPNECYDYMFCDCTSLNKITMLGTKFPTGGGCGGCGGCGGSHGFRGWVLGVPSTGTFIKNPGIDVPDDLPYGIRGVPIGWTVQNYSA